MPALSSQRTDSQGTADITWKYLDNSPPSNLLEVEKIRLKPDISFNKPKLGSHKYYIPNNLYTCVNIIIISLNSVLFKLLLKLRVNKNKKYSCLECKPCYLGLNLTRVIFMRDAVYDVKENAQRSA